MSEKRLTLGDLKPGSVAVFLEPHYSSLGSFIVGEEFSENCLRCHFPESDDEGPYWKGNPVRLIAEHGHIEPARIVIDDDKGGKS